VDRHISRKLALLTCLCASLLGTRHYAFADTTFTPNARGEQFLIALMEDDAHSYFLGNKSLINWGKETSPFLRVTAQKYFDDYQNNGLSANQEYLNKQVEITGQIASINADNLDSPYVAFMTSDPILTVNAYLNAAGMDEAEKYAARQSVTLFCTGAGVSITFPQLNNCYGEGVFFQNLNNGIQSSISDWLEGKSKGFPYGVPGKAQHSMLLFYFAAENITDQSPCKNPTPSSSCMNWLAQYIKSHKSAIEAEYSQFHSYLGVQ
jgi:hypothetical protein